jgi:hypothetical protein
MARGGNRKAEVVDFPPGRRTWGSLTWSVHATLAIPTHWRLDDQGGRHGEWMMIGLDLQIGGEGVACN